MEKTPLTVTEMQAYWLERFVGLLKQEEDKEKIEFFTLKATGKTTLFKIAEDILKQAAEKILALPKNPYDKITQGQIWEVTTDCFFTSGESEERNNGGRKTHLKKGEKIEIRYPYEWHFRTEDNRYFHARAETILKNAVLVGKIWEKVKFNNRASLEEILKLELYDRVEVPGSSYCVNCSRVTNTADDLPGLKPVCSKCSHFK